MSALKVETPEEIVQYIWSVLQGLRYGSLELIIHDSRIVQVDRRERFRFETETLDPKRR
jgi:hypothetical protein